jgi:hypothetical protein
VLIKYVFRESVPHVGFRNKEKANPQRIGEAIEKARKAVRPGEDVRAYLEQKARDKRHAMHPLLEWDDAVCGVKYRMEQINDLIRIIAVEDDAGEQTPAFISVVASPAPRAFYTPQEIMTSRDLQYAALRDAERDLLAFERRYRWMTDICSEVAEIRRKIRERRGVDADPDGPAP